MKTYITAIFFLLGVSVTSVAQQYMGNTQYLWNQLAFNPAVAGSKEGVSSGLFYRNQWAGMEGAPRTESAFVHSPLSHGSFGVGLNVMRDRLGMTSTSGAQASFAYHLGMRSGTLSFGLSGEFGSTGIDFTKADPQQSGDIAIPAANIRSTYYNFGFGMLFKNERFFAGLSVPRLLNAETSFTNGDNPSVATFQNSQHVHLTSGALFRLSQNTYMQPIALVRYVPGAPVQADLGCLFLLNKTLWVGSAYRWKDAVSAIFSYSITRSLKVGYAYDFTLTRLNNHLGSHELYLGFDLIKKRDGFYHPRFF